MKILLTADLHGYDQAYQDFASTLMREDYDVGVLCGDLMTFPSESDLRRATKELQSGGMQVDASREATDPEVVQRALQNKQNQYKRLLRRSGKPIVFVMGNDDGLLGNGCLWSTERGIVDVNQRRVSLGKYSFVGYHYTSPFIGGTFEKTESEQAKDLDELVKLIDGNTVLVTHGPPWGILDTLGDGRNVGSKALRRLIDERPPRLHLFGHIHRAFGIQGICANGAYPASRKFTSVDVERREFRIVEPIASAQLYTDGQDPIS